MPRDPGGAGLAHEKMRHVFVETNWVFGYAAPAHHKRLDAVELLQRSRAGEVLLHFPTPCLSEVRQPILTKCQPRQEADAVRRFLARARKEETISSEQDRTTREVLDRFEKQVLAELRQLDDTLSSIRREPGVEVFPLNGDMLERATSLSDSGIWLTPFDQAILAAILVRSEELRHAGELDLCFCEIDADLQPWDKRGSVKQPLAGLYDEVGLWVYGDFDLRDPVRPDNWPE